MPKIDIKGVVREIMFFRGTENEKLINDAIDELSELCGFRIKCSPIHHSIFPDGESNDRFRDWQKLEDKRAVLLQPLRDYKESFDLLEKCWAIKRQYKAERLVLVAPFMPFRRQDHPEKQEEVNRLRMFIEFLRYCGVDDLITVTPHSEQMSSDCEKVGVRFFAVDASPFFASAIRPFIRATRQGQLTFVFAPDLGSVPRAIALARHIHCSVLYCSQVRENGWEKNITQADEDSINTLKMKYLFPDLNFINEELVKDAIIIMAEDEVASGGTANKTARLLRNFGAKEVHFVFTHPVCVPGWKEVMMKGEPFEKIFVGDTIERGPRDRTGGRLYDVLMGKPIAQELFVLLHQFEH